MSDVKIEDLSPVPFFAHFLEGQFSKDLSAEEMKAVLGGSIVTMVAPSDQEGMPVGEVPDIQELLRRVRERVGQIPSLPLPGSPVTLAYPSDQEGVPLYPSRPRTRPRRRGPRPFARGGRERRSRRR